MRYLSLFSLALVFMACFAGLYWEKYKDNWCQTLGMAGTGVWAGLRFDDIAWGFYYLNEIQVFAHLSLASYFLGTAWKAWKMNNSPEKALARS